MGKVRMAKELSGVLRKNDKRESDKHPMYKGNIMIEGQRYWLAAWINKDQETGEAYMSLKAEKAEGRPAPAKTAPADDDIPF